MAFASDSDAAEGRGAVYGRRAADIGPALAHATARLERVSLGARRALSNFPEIDCLRQLLSPGTLAAAERRAEALGVGADQVLIAAGALSADAYARILARTLDLPFERLEEPPRQAAPIRIGTLIKAPIAGLLPLQIGGELAWVIAPQGATARQLSRQLHAHPELKQCLRITSPERLARFVHRHCGPAVAWRAVHHLSTHYPHLSALSRPKGFVAPWMLVASALITSGLVLPEATFFFAQIAGTVVFACWAGLRLFSALRSPPAHRQSLRPVSALPEYTVIVALYREQHAAADLVEALAALAYPREKLDIKFVVEADDPETRAALEQARSRLCFEIIEAPPLAPRTKPKALNVALPYARGAFTVVYDAEDRPETDQLRRALDAFAQGSERLACVQARLTIDNTRDSWLARLFTAEYAGQFDVLLPGLARLQLPIPLGGSSNHFRTDALRESGAWDPFNVTEDADLGTRLARAGYETTVISSSTYEEAPAELKPWLKQRTRWFKGWIQTWRVHMRTPWRLWRELSPAGFISFQFLFIGTVFAALIQPIAVAVLLAPALGYGPAPFLANPAAAAALWWMHVGALASGYATSMVLGWIGLRRRGLLSTAWALPLFVLYWPLLSLAAWLALFQYLRDPHRWDKTAHGLARTSRRASDAERFSRRNSSQGLPELGRSHLGPFAHEFKHVSTRIQ